MSGGVEINFTFPDWAGKLREREEELNRFVAAQVQTNRGMLFDQQGAHNGHPQWAPLRMRDGQILSRRGTLRKSIAPYNPTGFADGGGIVRFEGDQIIVGTKLAYARMMNNGTVGLPGGVLRPKNAKALKIPVPPGYVKKRRRKVGALVQALQRAKDADTVKHLEDRISRVEKSLAKLRSNKSKKKRERYLEKVRQQMVFAVATKNHELAEKMRKRTLRTLGTQGDFMFLKHVTIPPRPFDEWNEQDQAEIDAALTAKVTEVLNE